MSQEHQNFILLALVDTHADIIYCTYFLSLLTESEISKLTPIMRLTRIDKQNSKTKIFMI